VKKRIKVINGPNLNLLSIRDTKHYGDTSLSLIEGMLSGLAQELDLEIDFLQSNHEGVLIDAVQGCIDNTDALIINPGGYTHTSVALRDSLELLKIPVIEVHLSNIYNREDFRRTSQISSVVTGTISGLGVTGYRIALIALKDILEGSK
jgi:3-dehydroquinate dehydratase type II